MGKDFETILDECIDRVLKGGSIDECLREYPQYADELKPLLAAVTGTQGAVKYTPSANAQRAGRVKLYAALDKRRKPALWQRIFGNKAVWVSAACAAVVILAVFFGLKYMDTGSNNNIADPSPGVYPSSVTSTGTSSQTPGSSFTSTAPPQTGTSSSPSSSETTPSTVEPAETPTGTPDATDPEPTMDFYVSASPDGNFVFLVSDDVNAIEDFTEVNVVIDRVEMHLEDEGEWIIFEPETPEFDLAALPGDVTRELWRGDVPEGTYSKVFIYVDEASGILESSGETVEIKVPSGKLQLSISFEVGDDTVTSLVYDITVIRRGNDKSTDYNLTPQLAESGASRESK